MSLLMLAALDIIWKPHMTLEWYNTVCRAPLSTVKGAEQRNDNRQRDQDDVTAGHMVRWDVHCQTKIISTNAIGYFVFIFPCVVTKERTVESQHDVSGRTACTQRGSAQSVRSPAHTHTHTQHINNRRQFGLKQAGSTSLAVINCRSCFPMILSVCRQRRTPARHSGSGPWQRFSPEPWPLSPSLPHQPPPPLTFPLCPRRVQGGPAAAGWIYGPRHGVVEHARISHADREARQLQR